MERASDDERNPGVQDVMRSGGEGGRGEMCQFHTEMATGSSPEEKSLKVWQC